MSSTSERVCVTVDLKNDEIVDVDKNISLSLQTDDSRISTGSSVILTVVNDDGKQKSSFSPSTSLFLSLSLSLYPSPSPSLSPPPSLSMALFYAVVGVGLSKTEYDVLAGDSVEVCVLAVVQGQLNIEFSVNLTLSLDSQGSCSAHRYYSGPL